MRKLLRDTKRFVLKFFRQKERNLIWLNRGKQLMQMVKELKKTTLEEVLVLAQSQVIINPNFQLRVKLLLQVVLWELMERKYRNGSYRVCSSDRLLDLLKKVEVVEWEEELELILTQHRTLAKQLMIEFNVTFVEESSMKLQRIVTYHFVNQNTKLTS